jgi:hypothetical protein
MKRQPITAPAFVQDSFFKESAAIACRLGRLWRQKLAGNFEADKGFRPQCPWVLELSKVRCDDKESDQVFRFRRIGVCWVEGETDR